MELINATRMATGYNIGLEVSGRELLVVVVKGTFVLPKNGEGLRLGEEQLPLVMSDTFTGAPGSSAPVLEMDFAPRKQACDVLLTGHACAPAGREVARLRAQLRVGTMHKAFDVIGDRVWQCGVTGTRASEPQPFSRMPVSYDRAFGGIARAGSEVGSEAYLVNPVGRGWHKGARSVDIDGMPLPNTEAVGAPVKMPDDTCSPMALGPLGRGWQQRARFAGTYDEAWINHRFPFLPEDFDERYHQAAPEDQQLPIRPGPLDVVLDGFTPDGTRRFSLPRFEAPVHVFPRRGEPEVHSGRMDCISFEPDDERLTLTWRVTRPLRKSIFEIAQVHVGMRSGERWGVRGTSSATGVQAMRVGIA